MLTKLHRGLTRPATGRPGASAGIAVALALIMLVAAGPRPLPAPGGDGLAPSRAGAVSGGNGAMGDAVLPGLRGEAASPRAIWRALRTEMKCGACGAAPPFEAPAALRPASAADGTAGASGAPPVPLVSADHGGFHLRLIGTPRTPTGPPAARA